MPIVSVELYKESEENIHALRFDRNCVLELAYSFLSQYDEKIKWLKENTNNIEICEIKNHNAFETIYYIKAHLSDEKYTFWNLKYG